ncbi:MAG TPA: hypothetical protein VJU86_17310 [Pyrinomonadaceae bacterium]|nr:hypothetical protein [Pyrinomonadaceae bacterium]
MTTLKLNSILDQLDELKGRFDARSSRVVEKTIARLSRLKVSDADTLIRYHELLLFVRAYPQNASIVRIVETELTSFSERVSALRDEDADLTAMESPEVSGIAGTSVVDTFTYPIVSWLVKHQPGRVALDWDWFEDEYRLAASWPRFMPLLEEDASVEANVPYSEWLGAAAGGNKELSWLIKRFESLPRTEKEKAELYEAQKLYVRWTPTYRASRTGMRLAGSKKFYHREPLIQRRDVSLPDELQQPAPALQQLSAKQGEAILDMTREASTIRYRELFGFTHGDPRRVFKTSLGRGVELFIAGLPPNWRLPLRAYHAAMIFKNGVAIGYFEGLSLFERMESGFNLYYTFREGETAWLYAKILNVFRDLAGVTSFAIDPYQIGYENEEGIESGAFWFYRKLGFRPTSPEILKLVRREEDRIASRKGYRTLARTLRKIAAGPMIFEMDQTKSGDWDRFQLRRLGLRVQKLMAAKYQGDVEKVTKAAVKNAVRVLQIDLTGWSAAEMTPLNTFAVALALVPDLDKWDLSEKRQLVKIIEAKNRGDETTYLKLMQKHMRLRAALIKAGS